MSNEHDPPAEPGTPNLNTPASLTPLAGGVRLRLWMMMFLQYFAWGAWFVTLGTYIAQHTGTTDGNFFGEGFIGNAYGTAAIGGMIAPFFVGMIADRFFSTERILAVLHLVGALVLYLLTTVSDQTTFYFVLIGFFLCYMPTLALTNSLSFHHLTDPGRQFPGIRVLGTVGWIVAGLLVGWLRADNGQLVGLHIVELFGIPLDIKLGNITEAAKSIEGSTWPMLIAAGAQALLALFCLALPHTPPGNKGVKVTARDVLGLDALALMKQWSFSVFVIGSFLVAIPLQFYYNYTNVFLNDLQVANPAAKMSYGQISEIFFMLLMPLFFARLGVKWMLLVGMLAWAARYTFFAFGNGGDLMWMFYIGILLHGICYDFFFVTGQIYVDTKADRRIRGAAQGFIAFATMGVGSFIGAILSGMVDVATKVEGGHDWRTFWLIPAAGAGVVMILFALLFKDREAEAAAQAPH